MKNTTPKIQNKITGEILTAVYLPNTSGNMRYYVNGKSLTDKQFDKLYKIIEFKLWKDNKLAKTTNQIKI